MADERSDDEKLNEILLREDRYRKDAFRFVQEALEFTRRKCKRQGHVSCRELAVGVRDLARDRFGLMAKTVLNQWGIKSTRDIGEMVFAMVEEQIMSKQDSDTREDFDNVYDFDAAFEQDFRIELDS